MSGAMKVSYGEDVAYVQLGRGKVAATREVGPGLLLDVDEQGQAVGLGCARESRSCRNREPKPNQRARETSLSASNSH